MKDESYKASITKAIDALKSDLKYWNWVHETTDGCEKEINETKEALQGLISLRDAVKKELNKECLRWSDTAKSVTDITHEALGEDE